VSVDSLVGDVQTTARQTREVPPRIGPREVSAGVVIVSHIRQNAPRGPLAHHPLTIPARDRTRHPEHSAAAWWFARIEDDRPHGLARFPESRGRGGAVWLGSAAVGQVAVLLKLSDGLVLVGGEILEPGLERSQFGA
jgi:hypothetical protein